MMVLTPHCRRNYKRPRTSRYKSDLILAHYAERDYNLFKIGFESYKDYLNSELWREIRKNVLSSSRYKCGICNCGANQVHHIDYSQDTLLGKDLSHLISVCPKCHKGVEFIDGVKLDYNEMQQLMLRATEIAHRDNIFIVDAVSQAKVELNKIKELALTKTVYKKHHRSKKSRNRYRTKTRTCDILRDMDKKEKAEYIKLSRPERQILIRNKRDIKERLLIK